MVRLQRDVRLTQSLPGLTGKPVSDVFTPLASLKKCNMIYETFSPLVTLQGQTGRLGIWKSAGILRQHPAAHPINNSNHYHLQLYT